MLSQRQIRIWGRGSSDQSDSTWRPPRTAGRAEPMQRRQTDRRHGKHNKRTTDSKSNQKQDPKMQTAPHAATNTSAHDSATHGMATTARAGPRSPAAQAPAAQATQQEQGKTTKHQAPGRSKASKRRVRQKTPQNHRKKIETGDPPENKNMHKTTHRCRTSQK